MNNKPDEQAYRLVGRVLRPHGIRGEFIVYLESDFPEWLSTRKYFFLDRSDGLVQARVQRARFDGKRLILKLDALQDRNAVEAHRDAALFLPENEAREAAADPDYFFNSDLVGCEVFDLAQNKHLGVVAKVLEMPAQNLLEVTRDVGQPLLIPFVDAIVGEITQSRIEVTLPPGLEACFDETDPPKKA